MPIASCKGASKSWSFTVDGPETSGNYLQKLISEFLKDYPDGLSGECCRGATYGSRRSPSTPQCSNGVCYFAEKVACTLETAARAFTRVIGTCWPKLNLWTKDWSSRFKRDRYCMNNNEINFVQRFNFENKWILNFH